MLSFCRPGQFSCFCEFTRMCHLHKVAFFHWQGWCCFVLEGWSERGREHSVMGGKKGKKTRVHTVILTWVVQTRVLPAYTSLPESCLLPPRPCPCPPLGWQQRSSLHTKTLSEGEVQVRGFNLCIILHLFHLAFYH